jgi:hypothetical protein
MIHKNKLIFQEQLNVWIREIQLIIITLIELIQIQMLK